MKKEILSEEIKAMKYLLGYKRGVVISEQQAPQLGSIQPSNKSTADMFKDSLAATQGLGTNNKSAQDIYNDFQKQNSPTAQIYQDFQSKYNQPTGAPATGAPATAAPAAAAPATGTPAAAAPATGAPAAATNVSVPDLIKQLQTILNTKFGAKLTVDGKFGNLTQSAIEAAIKTLPAETAKTPPAQSAPPVAAAPTNTTPPVAAAPTSQFKPQSFPELKVNTTTPKLT